jgi:two-component system, chemotaxis family, protein-glutamate methylesterase/glutaminase
MIRVLIVDDSPTARALLSAILGSDPELTVVGEAADGIQALELTRKLRPDVITMDIRMPRMDGFEATKEIMIETPTPIVVVTSSRAVQEVDMSMHALRAGALAIVAKPAGPGSAGFDAEAQQLIAQVKMMAQVKVVRHWRPAVAAQRPAPPPTARFGGTRVIAMASSTGGPAALECLLTRLPGDFAVPILVVQHISRGFVKGLADWLNKSGPLQVKVAADGEALKKRTVYVAPDDCHLGVTAPGQIALSSAAAVGGFRPSATPLFESVAHAFGAAATALILTGMGEDGVVGLRAVRKAGGRVLAQDEKTCVVFGMPGVAVAAGLVDEVLPIEAMAGRLVELVQ